MTSAKCTALIEQLEAAIQQNDLVSVTSIIKQLSKEGSLLQVNTQLLGKLFNQMLDDKVADFDKFLIILYTQNGRLPTPDHYTKWIRYHITTGEPYKAICVYEKYRVEAGLRERINAVAAMVTAFLANEQIQMTIDRKFGFGHQRCRLLYYDILQLRNPLLNTCINQFLSALARRPMPDKLQLYQDALSMGYSILPETQCDLFDNIYITNETEIETLLALYSAIRDGHRIPNYNTTSHMFHLLLGKQCKISFQSNLKNPVDKALDIFKTVYTDGGTLDTASLKILMTRLAKLKRFNDVELVYNVSKQGHQQTSRDIQLDYGYAITLLQQQKVKEVANLLNEMILYAFHRQYDGNYLGPNGESIIDTELTSMLRKVHRLQHKMLLAFDKHYNSRTVMNEVSMEDDPIDDIIQISKHTFVDKANSDTVTNTKLLFNDVKHDYIASTRETLDICPIIGLAGQLISTYRSQKNYTAAFDIYTKMRNLNCVNHHLIGMIQWVPFEQEDWSGVLDLLKDIRTFRIPINLVILSAMIKSHLKLMDPMGAERLLMTYLATRPQMQFLEEAGWLGPGALGLKIVEGYIKAGQPANAAQLILRCRKHGVIIPETSTGLLLADGLQKESITDIMDMLAFIEKYTLTMSAAHYTSVINLDSVLRCYEYASRHNLQPYVYAHQGHEGWQFYLRARKQHRFRINDATNSMKSVKRLEEIRDAGLADGAKLNERHWQSMEKTYRRLHVFDKSMPQAGYKPSYRLLQKVDETLEIHAIKKWYPVHR
ncbi:hypothetical protein BDF19DRAFT_448261 [Syncephalis fuscata]|nr:hypothetical protein BDF19DRAFT_448261 [Syncephalis fuscata]